MLIGRFLVEKNINFKAMQNVMATLYMEAEGGDGGARRGWDEVLVCFLS